MVTYFDLIKDNDFRSFIEKRLREYSDNNSYKFPNIFPVLHRYRPLSKYAIDDIINSKLTITSVGEYNDLFDSSIQLTDDEMNKRILETKIKYNDFNIDPKLKTTILELEKRKLREDKTTFFYAKDMLDIYTCCFSVDNSSVLMWSHYADSFKGISVSYDFNTINNPIIKQTLFPVLYTSKSVQLSDLMYDRNNDLLKYPIDAAVLCATLNKNSIWSYEQEWRLVEILATGSPTITYKTPRIQIDNKQIPISVCFGFHFLKNFMYYDKNNKQEITTATQKLLSLKELLHFIDKNSIKLYFMMPDIGESHLSKIKIKAQTVQIFLGEQFSLDKVLNITEYPYILRCFINQVQTETAH